MASFVADEKNIKSVGEVFVLPEGREMVDESRARELVQSLSLQHNDFRKISLTNKSFSLDAAQFLAELLSTFPMIEVADLADMIAGRPEEEALQVLTTICNALKDRRLLEVDLSDNALGQKGIKACHGVLKDQPYLQSLKLCNNGLSVAAMEEVHELLAESTPTKLQTLHFYNNMSGDGGAEACAKLLAHCPFLADFRFSGTRALRVGSLAVARALKGHLKLIKLDLADNLFVEENSDALASALSEMPLLEWINLRDTSLEDEGTVKVAAALQGSAPNLRFVDFSGNDITGAKGGPALARLVSSKPNLEEVLAEDNDEFGGTGARLLAGAFRVGAGAKIQRVQLNSCGIPGAAAIDLARSLAEKPLRQLELNANYLSEEEIESVKVALESKAEALGEMEDNEEDDCAEDEMPEEAFIEELGGIVKVALISIELVGQPESKEEPAEVGDCFVLEEGREMVDAEKAAALVAKATEKFNDFRRISLTNKSFSEHAAAVLAEALSGFPSVCEANLADMIAGRPEEEALKVLKLVCDALAPRNLRAVDLSDNALGQKGIKACHGVLKEQEELESLKLCNNGLSEAAMEEVAELLLFRTPTKLRTLHFYNNMSGNNGAVACGKMLAHCPVLRDFRFSGTRALQPGSLAIAHSLKGHAALVSLDLADNTFTGENGKVLAVALREMGVLERVNLRDTSLEDEAACEVMAALQGTAPNLSHLDLSGNELSSEVGVPLAKLVASKPLLQFLHLEDNFELGENCGLRPLARAFAAGGAKDLTLLQLNSCGIKSKTAVALVRSLAGKPIAKLEMNSNNLGEPGLDQVYGLLEAMGLRSALGEMDDNDDDEEEEAEEEENVEGGREMNEIAALTSKLSHLQT